VSDEDDIIYWQDALEEVHAGRQNGLKCPFCYEGVIAVTRDERKTRLECQKCHHYIEGRFPGEADGQRQ
jgi:ribosomal protein S27AE